VGTVESASISLLPRLIELFAASHPLIHVSILVESAEAVTDHVAEGSVDIGFAFNPSHPDRFTTHLRKQYSLGAVVSKGNGLAKLKKVSMADCLKFPLVLPVRGLSIRSTLDRVIGRHANELRSFIKRTLGLMSSLSRSGRFVGIQTRLGIEEFLKAQSLVFVELPEPSIGSEEFAIITDVNSSLSFAARAFLQHTMTSLPSLL
jgi:DNA-binding transcriptional LysR family regulator